VIRNVIALPIHEWQNETRLTMQLKLTQQIAKHLREVHLGGNWSASNLRDVLEDVTWQQATTPVSGFHTIAALVYHINYFLSVTLQVMRGGPLDAQDKFSFDHPPVESEQDWENLLQKTFKDAEDLAVAIEQMPESQLAECFVDEKWGNYYRCLHGPIEHCHYHLGQIALIKSILSADSPDGEPTAR
jgi:DinB superfamily